MISLKSMDGQIDKYGDESQLFLGEKSLSLNLLLKEGLNTPGGFIITPEEIKGIVREAFRKAELKEKLALSEEEVNRLKNSINTLDLGALIKDFDDALDSLGEGLLSHERSAVCMRSSFLSRLNLPFFYALKNSEEMAIAFRQLLINTLNNGEDVLKIVRGEEGLSVILQPMIKADISGVVFSSFPHIHKDTRDDRILIRFWPGLGAGSRIKEGPAGTAILSHEDMRIKEMSNIGMSKGYYFNVGNKSVEERSVPMEVMLSDDEIVGIARKARFIASRIREDVMMEFSVDRDNGKVHYLDMKLLSNLIEEINETAGLEKNAESTQTSSNIVNDDFVLVMREALKLMMTIAGEKIIERTKIRDNLKGASIKDMLGELAVKSEGEIGDDVKSFLEAWKEMEEAGLDEAFDHVKEGVMKAGKIISRGDSNGE